MCLETDIRGLRQTAGINYRERTLAIAHQHPAAGCVHTHIVGIVTKLDAPDWGQVLAPQHMHRTITGVRYKYAVGKRDIRNALRLAQTGGPVQHLARRQIHDAKAVVAQLRNQQPLPLHIDSEVIDTAANLPKGYLRLEYQRWACRLRIGRGGPDETRHQKDRPPQHAQLFAILICASAAFSPSASFLASSLAQKCMKERCGWSSSMRLWSAETSIPCSRSAFETGFHSFAIVT